MSRAVEDAVLDILRETGYPVDEFALVNAVMERTGVLRDSAMEAIRHTLIRNEIRWVAFRGYALGGRP